VLFLDEMNRALPEVLQASFQLILDRNLNGVFLHPGTRIIAAINSASQYRVESMDPALRDRFAILDLRPTFDDWIDWARTKTTDGVQNVHAVVVDFITKNPAHLEHSGADQDPKKVYPSRRSWARLATALHGCGAFAGNPNDHMQSLIHSMSASMVGIEAATSFVPHVIDSTRQLTALDIFERFELDAELKTGKKKGSTVRERVQWDNADSLHGLNDRIIAHYSDVASAITDEHAERFVEYFRLLPGELRTSLWCKIMGASKGTEQLNKLRKLAPKCGQLVVDAVRASGIIPAQAATTPKK
jgi:hypothetical protein